jgi:hypothetical protein
MSLVQELKRRNVIRVAVAYAVVAWLVAQVAELALDSFGSPDWVMDIDGSQWSGALAARSPAISPGQHP